MTKMCGVASSNASAADMLTERSDFRISAKVSSDEPAHTTIFLSLFIATV